MEASFWHQKWEKGETRFHESETNEALLDHFSKLNLIQRSRVFLPLCGKTRDIGWLLKSGYQVVGAELSKIAICQLFKDLGVEPEITEVKKFTHYHAENIDIFVGDIFGLSADDLGSVDAVYDRAALVALPAPMRNAYVVHLMKITKIAPQLLVTYEYDQARIEGPPFSVNEEEVKGHYGNAYPLKAVEKKTIRGGRFKGEVEAVETVWLLQKESL